VLVGNRRLMAAENVMLGSLGPRRDELAAAGRTAVFVAVDGRAAGVIDMADAPRDTAPAQLPRRRQRPAAQAPAPSDSVGRTRNPR
jgi:cation transport ATPase